MRAQNKSRFFEQTIKLLLTLTQDAQIRRRGAAYARAYKKTHFAGAKIMTTGIFGVL